MIFWTEYKAACFYAGDFISYSKVRFFWMILSVETGHSEILIFVRGWLDHRLGTVASSRGKAPDPKVCISDFGSSARPCGTGLAPKHFATERAGRKVFRIGPSQVRGSYSAIT